MDNRTPLQPIGGPQPTEASEPDSLASLRISEPEEGTPIGIAVAEYKDKKAAFEAKAADLKIGKGENAKNAIELRKPMDIILGNPENVLQIPIANFKVHKVKPGHAKGVLGFQNTTVGEDTYTQLIFKPFDKKGEATINDTELAPQPLLQLNGEGESSGAKERKMTANMMSNIADAAYSDTSKSIEDVKTEWYDKAQNAFKATDGRDVYGQSMKAVKLVGGKSKKRRIQRRKSVRRRRMSNRKR